MATTGQHFPEFADKMKNAGCTPAAIRAFEHAYQRLLQGDAGTIPEESIQAVSSLPRFGQPAMKAEAAPGLVAQTVVLKLNGGLGTTMGLERAKSLLVVKNGLTFLDFISRQMLAMQRKYEAPLRFMIMNSFATSRDTMEFLKRYPELTGSGHIELLQGQVPKVDVKSLRPACWAPNPRLEWCPPGHGDLYPSLLGSGWLERLLAEGRRYLFVSNADNLGASLNLELLGHFAASGKPFLMEVAERTPSDRKGGHLAQRGSRLLLREAAQCPEPDLVFFQDIRRHQFFNTNNLWIRLAALKALLEQYGGFIPLPLIKNRKTIDPRDKQSPDVFQLETAMGAAVECFEQAGAIVVPRTRFAPVKTTLDLLALRSDAYTITDDWRLELAPDGLGQPPTLDLDANHYKLVDQLEAALANGVPSLKQCRELVVRGRITFKAQTVFKGKVCITNDSAQPKQLRSGVYTDCTLNL